MKITEEQKELLKNLSCERLASDPNNMRLVDSFENYKNPSIADVIKDEAFSEDENNKIAYYLIKDCSGEILFFFSLKCGLLYDEFIEGDKLEQLKHFYEYLQTQRNEDKYSDDELKTIDSILEGVRAKKGLKKEEVARIVQATTDSNEFDTLFDDNIKNVGCTFAGIEIVHFCANDAVRHLWNKDIIGQKLGTVVFWYFIVPKVLELMNIVGCEYIFLFAADKSENEELINYYTVNLHFKKSDGHHAAIPLYDFTCKFMYQETQNLEDDHKAFFDNFNPDEDAV